MLIKINEFKEIDKRKLMDVYAESNAGNVPYFYPDCKDIAEGVNLVEDGFLDFLKNGFFKDSRNFYCVWEEDGLWVSALRVNFVKEGGFYIEALETRPDCRRKGYGAKLLTEVLKILPPPFTISSSVGKRNTASVKCHEKCGFTRRDAAVNLLTGEKDDGSYGFIYVKN